MSIYWHNYTTEGLGCPVRVCLKFTKNRKKNLVIIHKIQRAEGLMGAEEKSESESYTVY